MGLKRIHGRVPNRWQVWEFLNIIVD